MSGPIPTPGPTPSAGTGSTPTPTPTPTPSPQPEYPPIPPLPDIPPNAYQLLLNLASEIDMAAGSFKTATGKLGDIHTTTNTAVSDVVANSQGEATNGLNDIWGYAKKDFTNAHTPLNSITAANALGGSPNQLQTVLDQHQVDFLNGVSAVEQLRNFMTSQSANLSVEVVQGLVGAANGLTAALGNVNMALQAIILAISNVNGGISYTCATGLVPGQPFPLFNQHAFAMEGNGGSGSSGLTADQIQQHLEDQGVDPETALDIALYAEEQGLSLSDVQQMFDSMVQEGNTPDIAAGQIQQLINNGSMASWLEGGSGRNMSDITALLNNDFSTDAVTTLLNQGADLQSALSESQTLLNKGVDIADINQWTQQGLNLKYADTLMDRGVTADQIAKRISDYTSTDPGSKNWTRLSGTAKNDIAAAFQRWATRTSTGIGNDGSNFNNYPQTVVQNGQQVSVYPFPGNKTGPYTEYNVGSTNNRIVVDSYGKAYYYPSVQGHYNPNDAIPIPYSFIAQILGG